MRFINYALSSVHGLDRAFLIKSIKLGEKEYEIPTMEREYRTSFIDNL